MPCPQSWHIIQPMLSAILLAAGRSERMGRLKQLMPLGESTIIERAIDSLSSSAVNEVIVVVGHEAEEITKAISAKPAKIVFNPNYREGMRAR